jgi:hypothetical protein
MESQRVKIRVIPAKAGIHNDLNDWIPAFAGMTINGYS